MKMRFCRKVVLTLTMVFLSGCVAGCSSKETGEIIDASTDEVVTSGSMKDDEETEEIVDAATGETVEKKEDKKQETQVSNDTYTTATNSEAPTSTKKVSFNRGQLYKMMVATYKEPDYIKEPTKSEFAHELRGQIPEKAQRIFDWYFGVMDGGQETEITVSDEEYNLFVETVSKVLNFQVIYECKNNGDNTKSLRVKKENIGAYVDRDYKNYCKAVQDANAPAKQQYDAYIAKAKTTCDLIEKAANAANIKGKDEVTAINNIINYICENCVYWDEAVTMKPELHKGEWICDCLQDHHAVCSGYAKTFYAMCYYAGIDVTYYWGYTDNGSAHAWNSIKINGKDYYFDVTWYDAMQESGSSKDTYIWMSNSEFSKEHIKKGTDITFW